MNAGDSSASCSPTTTRSCGRALRGCFRDQPDIEVVGEASDGVEAVELVLALQPDVVIMDINMPKGNGYAATRRICAEAPKTRVIALTVYTSPDMEGLVHDAGATAYLTKDGPLSVLLDTIRSCVNLPKRS